MKRSRKAVFLILGLALPVARLGAAEDTNPDRTLSPYFFVENGDPAVDRLPLKETRADVHITGVIADVVVTQVYRNEGSRPLNARYVFPASTRAAVHGMTMQVGDQRIRARIREKQAAKQEFEAAREAGKSAALLEQQRPNVFTMNVANVMPQDEIARRAPLQRVAGADRRYLRVRLPHGGWSPLLDRIGGYRQSLFAPERGRGL